VRSSLLQLFLHLRSRRLDLFCGGRWSDEGAEVGRLGHQVEVVQQFLAGVYAVIGQQGGDGAAVVNFQVLEADDVGLAALAQGRAVVAAGAHHEGEGGELGGALVDLEAGEVVGQDEVGDFGFCVAGLLVNSR